MMRYKHYGFAVLLVLLAFGLAWASNHFMNVSGAGLFTLLLILGAVILYGGKWLLSKESLPKWLLWGLLGAALLRLAAGVLWHTALPVLGYDNEVQNAGYVMEDAFQRDTVAWQLADSEKSLFSAFTDYRLADQYGGLLFLSAAIYRFTGGDIHHPLLIVIVTASVSALAVLFTWAAAQRLFGDQTAKWAAWGLALYSEAVLLGSTQMREPFLMAFSAAAVYGLILFHQERGWKGLVWVGAALVLSLPLSPALAVILMLVTAIVGLSLDEWRILRNKRLWLVLGGLGILVVAGMWLGWGQIAPTLNAEKYANPLTAVVDWVRYSARYQVYINIAESGWLQKITRSTPDWMDLPFLVAYGVVRPLLPAALAASGAPFWRVVAVWRASGWTVALALLVLAPFLAVFSKDVKRRSAVIGMVVAAWVVILIASFWGGGDMWDNPRYRTAFVVVQMIAAAWAFDHQRRNPNPWVKRLLVVVGFVTLWVAVWYFDRYAPFGWPIRDPFVVIGLGILCGGVYTLWDWRRSSKAE